jgi:uncharacterized protein (TIGR02246 family)
MKSKRRLCYVLLAMVPAVAWACGEPKNTSASAPDRVADEVAIRAVIAANEAAANRHDAAGVAATYVADADLIAGSNPLVAGRDAIRRHEEAFMAATPALEFKANPLGIRFLGPDVAIVECNSTHRFASGETRERATLVLVRRDGAWAIAAVRVLPPEQS